MAKAKAKKPARKPYTAQAALKGKNASIKNRETNEKIRRITEAEGIEAWSRFRPSAVIARTAQAQVNRMKRPWRRPKNDYLAAKAHRAPSE